MGMFHECFNRQSVAIEQHKESKINFLFYSTALTFWENFARFEWKEKIKWNDSMKIFCG